MGGKDWRGRRSLGLGALADSVEEVERGQVLVHEGSDSVEQSVPHVGQSVLSGPEELA